MKHPMQPIHLDALGTVRFQGNEIIKHLVECGVIDLNKLAVMDFSNEDRMQLAQLMGYSVSGFGDLPYADPAVVAEADKIVQSGFQVAAQSNERIVWEYDITAETVSEASTPKEAIDMLNARGAQGWELVQSQAFPVREPGKLGLHRVWKRRARVWAN